MVILHDDEYYRSRIPQPDLGPLGNFLRFVWDKERKTFLGRTAFEWGRLGVFYLCFFTVLGSIFAIQMKISIDYVSRLDRPFFQYTGLSPKPSTRFSRSTFGSPGIVFKPNSISTTSPIISVDNSTSNTRPKRYIQALSKFLQEYDKDVLKYDLNCHNEHPLWNNQNTRKPCYFDARSLGKCSKPPYGYAKPLQPCVLIKFNKRFDWIPESYNYSSKLPENMPEKLKKTVRECRKVFAHNLRIKIYRLLTISYARLRRRHLKCIESYRFQFYVWLSCDGANNVDKEHIGELEYIPSPGFPIEYFPFTGQSDYLSPIVALKFKNLTPDRLVTVECNLWAANIEQRSRYSLDFQIMISDH